MKKKVIILLIFAMVYSGCSSNLGNREIESLPDIEQLIVTPENPTTGPDDISSVPTVTVPLEEGNPIQGENGFDKFTLDEDGMFHFPTGNVKELSYLLPGYKKVIVDKDLYNEDIENIFKFLAKAEIKPSGSTYYPMDGAGLMMEYVHNSQATNIQLLSFYNMKTVFVRYNMEEESYHDSGLILSEEICKIIHKISGWEAFDTAKLKEIDSISIQVTSGEQASDLVVTLSGEEARDILDRMSNSSEVIDWNNGGYNILMKMYKGEVLTYNAYFSGDSSPTIGIESQFFRIDSDIVREIYKLLNYDMTVS